MSEAKIDDRAIAVALVHHQGNLSAAARRLSADLQTRVKRSYVSKRIDASPALQLLLEDIQESLVDDAEATVAKAVLAGHLESSKFLLTTLGRDRGYSKVLWTMMAPDVATLAKRLQEARARSREERPER